MEILINHSVSFYGFYVENSVYSSFIGLGIELLETVVYVWGKLLKAFTANFSISSGMFHSTILQFQS